MRLLQCDENLSGEEESELGERNDEQEGQDVESDYCAEQHADNAKTQCGDNTGKKSGNGAIDIRAPAATGIDEGEGAERTPKVESERTLLHGRENLSQDESESYSEQDSDNGSRLGVDERGSKNGAAVITAPAAAGIEAGEGAKRVSEEESERMPGDCRENLSQRV